MAGNLFGKIAADSLGLSDIGVILTDPADFDKVSGDDYIMHEDGEKIFFVIQSRSDEYVFSNYGLLFVDGTSALSKKRTVYRYDYYSQPVHHVTLETAGTVDLDVEIKFSFGNTDFSVDVDKRQLEQLKDLYKCLVEIGRLQAKNKTFTEDAIQSLALANESLSRLKVDSDPVELLKSLTNFNFAWTKDAREKFSNRDFSSTFEKYINN